MNRIAPGTSELYIANADGSNERKVLGNESTFDYQASFSPDGQWITFTTERNGDGNSDIYRVRPDGTGLEQIIATSSYEAQGVLSPDSNKIAYVSTANNYKANVWIKDLKTGEEKNLTNTALVAGNSSLPEGYFRPAWSPDGEWLAFSSARNTQWRGHGNGTGWEHTQELSIYIIRPDGSGFRQLATKTNYCLGSPKFSPDGKRVIFYEITTEATWDSHRPEAVSGVTGQLVSVDFETGQDRIEHTSGPGLKMNPQWVTNDVVGYLVKTPANEGLNYTAYTTIGDSTNGNGTYSQVKASLRSPSWSPDGTQVVYEKVDFKAVRPMGKQLYSWDADWEYRFTDVFPQLSLQGRLAITQKQLGNSSVVTMKLDATDLVDAFDVYDHLNDTSSIGKGLTGAFQPSWSPDGRSLVVGLGSWFQSRATGTGVLWQFSANGSAAEQLTLENEANSGFPSYAPDGKSIVYRVFGKEYGLRIMDLATRSVRILTNGTADVYDNTPMWSPDGERIVFARRRSYTNFDVATIRPDGTDLRILTSSGGNDAHAVWSHDGRIMYSTAEYGFRDECATYDQTFQPYGQIAIMDADGQNKRLVTDSMWEDSMPLFVGNEFLG
ncbi:hypothetical protein DPSP01_012560 [Paraphaeosphaeria sporulosa]|uniref:Dipeptidyl peptidase IV/CD26, N-terminal domain-containing protein n=1 Tax=Paraphaeosphaeria sporulosa TaxID=1460663 RepID=A0A177C7U0_9PLEO|nr:dipeptidyl peptidase IV/CD26, N-terminal domain-containing protein [Paraphaeosphaeria sporulosa]OAG03814.1 dipeptidyl peptidase IV/CD26, N-terminal domain-containing protein [Paraphaeosphaeria sporulosa]